MMQAFGRGVRGSRGGRGGQGCGRGAGKKPFKHMISEFMNKFRNDECYNWNSEQWQEKIRECGPQWNKNMNE